MPFQEYRHGYDVAGPAITGARNEQHDVGVNGWLTFRNKEQPLWIEEVTADFALSASTGQSYRNRSLFPRNFQQLAFNIGCQFPSQGQYGRLCEFVRWTQTALESSVVLEIIPRKLPLPAKGWRGNKNRAQKGPHAAISAEGYITRIRRHHVRHEYAPSEPFTFVVERMISPSSWAEEPTRMRRLASWHDIIEEQKKSFVEDPVQDDPKVKDRPPNPHPNDQGRMFGGPGI